MSVSEASVITEPETAPARSRRETRRRLIEAGTELFATLGLQGATSARIARHAGVASGTFYLHFKDKQELFREIVFEALDKLRARQREAAAHVSGGPLAEVRARYRELLDFAEENRDLFRVLFGRGHEAADLGEDVLDAIVPGIEERMRERAGLGEGLPALHPGVAAQAVVAMVTRVMAWWLADPERAPREAVLETLTRLHPVARSLEPADGNSSKPQSNPRRD